MLRGQPDNEHDLYAVAIVNNGEVVGHIPRMTSKVVCFFLRYDGNEGYCVITGARLNRGVGLGLEVPCLYKFCGKMIYLKKLKEKLDEKQENHSS